MTINKHSINNQYRSAQLKFTINHWGGSRSSM